MNSWGSETVTTLLFTHVLNKWDAARERCSASFLIELIRDARYVQGNLTFDSLYDNSLFEYKRTEMWFIITGDTGCICYDTWKVFLFL